jgi:hypothetical protein
MSYKREDNIGSRERERESAGERERERERERMKRDARGKRTSLTNVVSRPCQSVTVVLCRADIENRLCLMYVRGAENRTKTTMDSSLSSNPEPKHEQPLPLSLQWFRRNHTHTRRPATCLPLLKRSRVGARVSKLRRESE